jgi:hypothetical protein
MYEINPNWACIVRLVLVLLSAYAGYVFSMAFFGTSEPKPLRLFRLKSMLVMIGFCAILCSLVGTSLVLEEIACCVLLLSRNHPWFYCLCVFPYFASQAFVVSAFWSSGFRSRLPIAALLVVLGGFGIFWLLHANR